MKTFRLGYAEACAMDLLTSAVRRRCGGHSGPSGPGGPSRTGPVIPCAVTVRKEVRGGNQRTDARQVRQPRTGGIETGVQALLLGNEHRASKRPHTASGKGLWSLICPANADHREGDRERAERAAGGSFTLLRFAEPELPDFVYIEQLTSALYLDNRQDIDHYLEVMNELSTQAFDPRPHYPVSSPRSPARSSAPGRKATRDKEGKPG